MPLIRFCFLLTLVVSLPAQSEVFKWTDENGKTHFGDKPPVNTRSTEVDTSKVNVMKAAKPAASTIKKSPLFKKDTFRMPITKSKTPYRFVLTTAVQDKQPIDRLDSVTIDSEKKNFTIYVKLTGVEANEKYNFQARVLDAKGELIFNKTTFITTGDNNSLFFVNKLTPNLNIDAPGNWTFQAILNKKALYVERRKIVFVPRKPKFPTSTGSSADLGQKFADKSSYLSKRDASKAKAIKEWEASAGHSVSSGISGRSGAAAFLAKPNKLSRDDMIDSVDSSKLRNLKCPVKKRASCDKRQLQGADYSRLMIIGMSFMQANLEGASFSGSEIYSYVTFAAANLKGADFSGAKLNNVAFTGADLTGANFRNVDCNGCTFDEANLTGVVFSGNRINQVTFKKANMKNVKFERPMMHWTGFDMTEAINFDINLSGLATLSNVEDNKGLLMAPRYSIGNCNLGSEETTCLKANLAAHKFLPIDVQILNLSGANLSNADLSAVHARSLIFDGANLSGATLPKMSNSSKSSFVKANLSGIKFKGNKIAGDFTGANFTNANLSKQDMKRAIIKDAIFKNANVSKTKFNLTALTKANIKDCAICQDHIDRATVDVPQFKESLSKQTEESATLYKKDKEAYAAWLKNDSKSNLYTQLLVSGEGIISKPDLIDVLKIMLSTDSPGSYTSAFKIMKKYQEVYFLETQEITPFCISPKLIDVVLPKLTYKNAELDESSSQKRRSRRLDSTSVRQAAIRCVIQSDFENIPAAHNALIDAYQKEEDNELKRALVYGLRESRYETTLPLLSVAVKDGDIKMSDAAANSLAAWQYPPVELLPWLVEKTKGNRNIQKGWTNLLGSYGGSAKDYLPELKESLAEIVKNKSKSRELNSAISKVRLRSKVNDMGALPDFTEETVMNSFLMPEGTIDDYSLKYSEQLTHFLPIEIPDSEKTMVSKFKSWVSVIIKKIKDEPKAVISNPVYSEDEEVIHNHLSRYGLFMKDSQRTDAVAGVEYYTNRINRYGQNKHFGVDVLVTRTEATAKEIAVAILEEKQPRRIVATKGKVIYLLWADAAVDEYLESRFYQEIRNK